MKKLWITIAAGIWLLGSNAFAEVEPPTPSIKIVSSFLVLIDQEEFALSWELTTKYFQQMMPLEQWVQTLANVRSPLEKLSTRVLISSTPATSLPGVPDGEYEILVFQSSFIKKAEATETVTVMKEADGAWRVAGYFIK